MPRYETDLSTRISSALDAVNRARLVCRLAAYKARKGDTSEAKRLIADIRERFSNYDSAEVYANIYFAEALVELIDNGPRASLEKLMRVRALYSACQRGDDLPPLVDAWFAQLRRGFSQWGDLEREIRNVVETTYVGSSEVRSRLALTIADSYFESHEDNLASYWYDKARLEAIAIGDDAAISAILYNRAAMHVFSIRMSVIEGREIDVSAGRLALEAASAQNYTKYVNERSLSWVFSMLSGQISLLSGEINDALAALSDPRLESLREQWPSAAIVWRADLLRCHALTNAKSSSAILEAAVSILPRLRVECGVTDRSIAANSLSIACERIDPTFADECRKCSVDALELWAVERKKLREVLRRVEPGLSDLFRVSS